LDRELVRRGLAADVDEAATLVGGGHVRVGGAVASSAARLVDPADAVEVHVPPRFVGRGGDKLDAALEQLEVEVRGRRALDAGASTGGFTDCLLQRGAASVTAVDTGHGQLHERLRGDPRVAVRERTDIRALVPGPEAFDLAVADLAFISLRSVLSALLAHVAPGGDLVLLVKPQFEARREEADRGAGVIRDPKIWRRVLEEIIDALVAGGATIMGGVASTIRGSAGNVEFFVHARVRPSRTTPAPIEPVATAWVDAAIERGEQLAAGAP
jgi:23S rRNA (cytidine1920-2'-O)/16S rRNA (cytidine1409-2'-O)-methyltransferase